MYNSFMKANESARHDPAINERVKEIINERNAVLLRLEALAKEALTVAASYPYPEADGSGSVTEALKDVRILNISISRALNIPKSPDNETYVGNLSALYFSSILEDEAK